MTDKQEVLKYFERLNIPCLSISSVKNLIKNDIIGTLKTWSGNCPIDVGKQCFHIIGPAGVGKTDICKQIANELTIELNVKFNMIMVKAPVLSRDDFIIPFPIIDGSNTSFKMLYSDFVPKDKDSYGIFVIDEFSRGDHSLQQLLWQIQNEYSVHRYNFPKGWFVISTDNPDDQEYSMDILEDAAGLRRQLHIYTDVDSRDFLNYAKTNNFHKHVINFVESNPDKLYDFKAQKIGSVFANPASYEKLSNILWKFEKSKNGIQGNIDNIQVLAGGLLNVSMARLFIDFIVNSNQIGPKDIMDSYFTIRDVILDYINNNDNANLSSIMDTFMKFIVADKPKINDIRTKNIATFISDLPLDTAALFIMTVEKQKRGGPEFAYLSRLNVSMMANDDYKNKFYDRMVKEGESKNESI